MLEDFAVLFRWNWYRDFPVSNTKTKWTDISVGNRSLWTNHIAFVFRQATNLMGLFARFEDRRLDGLVLNRDGVLLVAGEWEWDEPATPTFNELEKLKDAEPSEFAFLFTYTSEETKTANLGHIAKQWATERPLLLALLTYSTDRGRRFEDLEFHVIVGNKSKLLIDSRALPWEVGGTRWVP